MKNEGLNAPAVDLPEKDVEAYNKLLDIMSQIDDGRGWRFTDEQADTLAKLVDGLVEQIREYNRKRNEDRKRHRIFFLK